MYAHVIGDIVAIIAQGRRKKRQQPETGDAEILDVIKLLDQPAEVADSVVVAVKERFQVELVDDSVFVPERIGSASGAFHVGLPPWSAAENWLCFFVLAAGS